MDMITVVDGEDYKLEVNLSRPCSPVTLEAIREYLVSNKHTTMFKYTGYWKYQFSVKTKPIVINGETFVITGFVGGTSDYIYKFSPEESTLFDDFNYAGGGSECPSDVYIEFCK
uniref:Uncharacterized protein n=1 Tax=Clandestinovirus TaxID=2831644 RepID=A0A8F8KPQ0_9VIRU|nr:hypothetical protein KOM_12_251 [Clandestinovirus]